jgi:hypothetical protein
LIVSVSSVWHSVQPANLPICTALLPITDVTTYTSIEPPWPGGFLSLERKTARLQPYLLGDPG